MDQPPAVAFTAFADVWPRAIEMEIGAALCAIGRGKDFDFDFDSHIHGKYVIVSQLHCSRRDTLHACTQD